MNITEANATAKLLRGLPFDELGDDQVVAADVLARRAQSALGISQILPLAVVHRAQQLGQDRKSRA